MIIYYVNWRCLLKNTNKFLALFSSVKLTIILLATIATTSILGTVIPQNSSPDSYLYLYGDFFYRVFNFTGLFDMYHSLWFQLILLILGINIVTCTFTRLPNIFKFVFFNNKNKKIKFKKFSQNIEFKSFRNTNELSSLFCSHISNKFSKSTLRKINDETIIHAETRRWTKFSPHIIHLSVLLLLMGSLISLIFGFEGYVNIIEGNTVNSIRLKKNNKLKVLDFGIRCDNFDVKLYENGVPKKYVSQLTLIKEGVPVLKKEVIVNDPIHYNGISIFQSSYGKIPSRIIDTKLMSIEHVEVVFKIKDSGKTYTKELKIGISTELPENLGQFSILEYLPSTNFNGVNIGRAFRCAHYCNNNNSPEIIILPLDFPNFDLMRSGKIQVSLSNKMYDKIKQDNHKQISEYYTGLQVTKDPGKWIVYTGFILIILGFMINLFMSYKEIYIKIINKGKYNKVSVSGYINGNKLATKAMINRMYRMM